ncbi:Long-chain-alcohol dehydrogenase 1 [subsurface metagenome]
MMIGERSCKNITGGDGLRMKACTFEAPGLIIYGRGKSEEIGARAKNLGAATAVVISDKNIVKTGIVHNLCQLLKEERIEVTTFDGVDGEPSVETIKKCMSAVTRVEPDVIVGVGGGSCLDTAKTVAVLLKMGGNVRDYIGIGKVPAKGLPMILLPTTAGTGAETTPNAIIADKAAKSKEAIVSRYLLPDVAIVDPSFTDTVPPRVAAFTGVDAFTHALECYVSRKASPFTDVITLEAIRLIAHNLKKARDDRSDKEARDKVAFGSLLGGLAITNSGTGGVHALAYPLGSMFGVPHGLSNAVMLPWVSEFNLTACLFRFARVAAYMGEDTEGLSIENAACRALSRIRKLLADVQVPTRLTDVGIRKEDIPILTESAAKVTRLLENNPREMDITDIKVIYENAL